jgi:hypothetical protein
MRSIDATKGAVPSTEGTLGKEHKNATVEVEARNQAGRLAACEPFGRRSVFSLG